MGYGPGAHKVSDMTEWLPLSLCCVFGLAHRDVSPAQTVTLMAFDA